MTAKAHQRQPKRMMREPMFVITFRVDWMSTKNWKKGIKKQIKRIRLMACT